MRFRTIVILCICGLLALFALLNWSALTAPTELSLLVTSVQAPLGLIMLIFVGILMAVVLSHTLRVQINALTDSRKQAAELRAQRDLADQAEASRFNELRKYLEAELQSLKQAQASSEQRLHDELTVVTNTLAACIGEIDDRLERQYPARPEHQP